MSESNHINPLAATMLDQRIHNMRRLNEKTWIDTSLITHEEYQLFLDEMYTQGKYHQPDHWAEKQFAPDQGQTPVVGVRSSDATAFCEWMTTRYNHKFRIPKAQETTSMQDTMPGFWQTTDENEIKYKGNKHELEREKGDTVLNWMGHDPKKLAFELEHVFDVDWLLENAFFFDYLLFPELEKLFDRSKPRIFDDQYAQALMDMTDEIHDLFQMHASGVYLGPPNARELDRARAASLIYALLVFAFRVDGFPAFEGILIVREDD